MKFNFKAIKVGDVVTVWSITGDTTKAQVVEKTSTVVALKFPSTTSRNFALSEYTELSAYRNVQYVEFEQDGSWHGKDSATITKIHREWETSVSTHQDGLTALHPGCVVKIKPNGEWIKGVVESATAYCALVNFKKDVVLPDGTNVGNALHYRFDEVDSGHLRGVPELRILKWRSA